MRHGSRDRVQVTKKTTAEKRLQVAKKHQYAFMKTYIFFAQGIFHPINAAKERSAASDEC